MVTVQRLFGSLAALLAPFLVRICASANVSELKPKITLPLVLDSSDWFVSTLYTQTEVPISPILLLLVVRFSHEPQFRFCCASWSSWYMVFLFVLSYAERASMFSTVWRPINRPIINRSDGVLFSWSGIS
ncbi:hypothetical protein BS47DRAFT_1382085 [Hydnum rufescens UP504]|uniref:Secreted protein n=1 Tax=Hydnum rufescens UP504 TaxID=1448309 RepID=A0A9P6DWX4_9AGAM|nr:hypothetical protein BS47DRAFT_1382085 [Hydnum rufescens UP504]